MNTRTKMMMLICLLAGSLYFAARCQAQQAQPSAQTSPAVQATQTAAAVETAEGEKRFHANCGRCHNPPEDLSPREARAVVRQMRVKATLSAEDERLILKYLAP